jgi:putative spermidine/putrescine transport system substrate-binding protein
MPISGKGPAGAPPAGQRPVLSRRGVTKRLLVGAASAAALAGMAAPALGRSPTLEKELVFSGRGGTLGNVWKSKVIPPFERQFNCKVTYVTNDSVPAFAKVVAERANPQADVLWATDQTHVQGKMLGVFDKLDFDRIPNAAQCYSLARTPDNIGMVWSIGACVLQYNTKIYKEHNLAPPAAWNDVFRPETKGHVAWLDLSTLQGITAFLMLNKLNGGSEANVDPGFSFMKANLANIVGIVSSPSQLDDLFQQNEAWIAANVDGRVLALKSRNFPVELVHAREGVPQIGVQLDLIKGAPHPNLAHEFVNWAVSEEMQAIVGTDMGLGPVNKNTKLDAKVAGNIVFGPEAVSQLVQFDYEVVMRDFARWLDRWNRELSR